MKQASSSHIKFKVIISYVLLVLLSGIAVAYIYEQITTLTKDEPQETRISHKLVIVGNTITELYEAEIELSKIFTQTGCNSLFTPPIDIIQRIKSNIDSLKNMTTQTDQKLRIDSILFLLDAKINNLNELLQTDKIPTSDDFYRQAIASIQSDKKPAQKADKKVTPEIKKPVASETQPEKKRKGLLDILFKKKEKPEQTAKAPATSPKASAPEGQRMSKDSVIHILKTVQQENQRKKEIITQKISEKEYNIIQQSREITRQLKRVLSEYEQEEIKNSLDKISQREEILTHTTRIVAWIVIIAFLVILFFGSLIIRDISNSQRIRRELENAKKYADQLLESRKKFMLAISHDIKSPLSSIIGFIDLLLDMDTGERQREFLKNMKASSLHILDLVTNLLNISKLEDCEIQAEEVQFNPKSLLEEIGNSFVPLAKRKDLSLSCNIAEGLDADFIGDTTRIREIVVNIMSNAVKYTYNGGVYLTADITSDKQLILKIEDTGVGMTKEEQEIIFKEFTRLPSAETVEGTGLGLTITLKLIQSLNGDLSIKSQPEKGSCFIVKLPLKQAQRPHK